ncbi:MAG: alpha-amylase family glycosyl hydrolase [Opitutaceae bacterium]
MPQSLLSTLQTLKKTVFLLLVLVCHQTVQGEAMLQYFNTDWAEITRKMPELAEAGYSSLWLPPPTKGSGGLSVGYDLWDPFDLGSKNQRNTVRTRYGTEAELLELVKTAHRFGIRIYFDNIMNHRAFDIPGYNEDTPIDVYPGLVPEDFHLQTTQEGFYRKWDNTRDWNSAWQVQNLGLADLIDIAQEPGTTNQNFGSTEGSTFPKIKLIRDLERPEQYYEDKDYNYVGFGGLLPIAEALLNTEGNPTPSDAEIKARAQQYLQDNASVYEEYVEAYLNRAARWLMDRTKADGLRLDAVKHVRADFFGATYGENKDADDYGYLGQVQRQFNLTRGFSDWDNHRDTVFNTEAPRDDAMLFGEHLGEPPGYSDYFNSGMRLVDNPLRQQFNDRLGSPWNGLNGYDSAGAGGFDPALTVMHAQSHDNDYASRRELQHAMYFTRAGLGLLYTDGNYQAETLGESGGAFPRHANTSFLGQWDDARVPNILYIHEQFARGDQIGKYSDGDVVIYERMDKRENGGMSDADGVTMLFMLNDDYSSGHGATFSTSFPATAGGSDAYLYNYSTYGGGFYKYASELVNGSTIIPEGGYFVFGWKNPDPSILWANSGGRPLTIYQDGDEVGTVDVLRQDGPNGDADFHGDTLPISSQPIISNSANDDYTYTATVPRITDGTKVRFVARADGSAENILLKLDGGIDLNDTNHSGGDPRDNPPALATDTFLGYEQASLVERIGPEKFAAVDTTRCIFGSAGAETYTAGAATTDGVGNNPQEANAATFAFHNPTAGFEAWVPLDGSLATATQLDQTGASTIVWLKTNSVGADYKAFVYYTTDNSNPEGASGWGRGTTQVAEASYVTPNTAGGNNWWRAEINPTPVGTIKYKIGIYKTAESRIFPTGVTEVALKTKMMTTFQTSERDLTTVNVRPHNDYGVSETGLEEGMHMISARAFLDRANRASIYNTFKQTFYYDTERPQGEIRYPENDGNTVDGSNYGVVVRTDATVEEVWYRIEDADTSNDDIETGVNNGNGDGFEPFTDTDQDGTRDLGEAFEDLNENGIWDDDLTTENWVQASELTPSLSITPSDPAYRKEWRFDYNNIPATIIGNGEANIKVRLREISSSEFKDFSLSDINGHYSTLVRNVNVNGPDERVFIAFPASDRQIVDDSYVMKVYFTKSLADGLTEQQLIDRFLISIGSNEEGDSGEPQSRDDYSIAYNETADYHALAYQLPNLYNDLPQYDHKITVVHDRPSGTDFEVSRIVRALPVTTPRVLIVNPPELGSDGRNFEIVLPDIPAPLPTDRQFTIQVATNVNATDVTLNFVNLRGSTIGVPTSVVEGSSKLWNFTWSSIAQGTYRFTATVTSPGGNNTADRNTTVIFREQVEEYDSDPDDDDDGLLDDNENTPQELPEVTSDQWTNGDIHAYYAYGRSSPTSPDTDGDGLPDGLEVGWRNAVIIGEPFTDTGYDHDANAGTPNLGANNAVFDWNDDNNNGAHDVGELSEPFTDTNTDSAYAFGTILTTDTNGDGFPNFISDLDPPFYNVVENYGNVPNVDSISLGGDRTRQSAGSVTDPTNPDSDYDGIPDGVEDSNRNGWIDGDGASIDPAFNPWAARDWPDGVIQPSENWTETDPNNADTDGDGASDGYSEDTNFDGVIEGDSNTNRTYDTGEEWSETDPLNSDTDGDGLPDGWEYDNGLDPLDNGIDSLRTMAVDDGNTEHGGNGDPDGDGFTNAQELANGTRARENDNVPPPPANSIVIGPGDDESVGNAINLNEFTDWTVDDLLVLDEYDGNGTNNQGGDIYKAYDGFDESRDIVAFYFRDGGADGKVYFRFDFQDLQAFAEEGHLDTYIVIDTGNTTSGESALPEDLDTRTEMKWEVLVAIYQTDNGAVYVDTPLSTNTTTIGEDLFANGVVRRTQADTNGFGKAYFNSDLDSMEASISRQALLDAGWNGTADNLNFQVFTTRDGVDNSGPGLGDIGGRSDVRDSIRNDYIASSYYKDQSNLAGDKSVLYNWFSRTGDNDRGKRAKVALLAHGNQPIRSANEMHDRINDGAGTGYYRLVDTHEAFAAPVNLHITPTLASALQWAVVDPSVNKPWRDGPTLNLRISSLLMNGDAMLFGTTFADQVVPFATTAFTQDSVDLADEVLSEIYSYAPSSNVFWPAERLVDDGVLNTIQAMGYSHTVVDQMRHFFKWFGRTQALGQTGYQINDVNNMGLFPIHDFASTFRFDNHDNGLNMSLRELLNRRARDGTQDQVLSLLSDWEDFRTEDQADAYDLNLRWIANRPWVELVTLDDVATGEIDLSQPADGSGDTWSTVNRGTGQSLQRTAKDYIDHATQEDYSNWYNGQSGREEGLANKTFEVRSGINLPDSFGQVGIDGIADATWNDVATISNADTSELGRTAAHAAMFVTAFHDQQNNDLSKFSTGTYIYPDTDFNNLADFSKLAQSQMRFAALYKRVDTWAATAPSVATKAMEDIDRDGEVEYLLYNETSFAVFEAIGGRCVAAFARNTLSGAVYQIIGTQPTYAGFETEDEGIANVDNNEIGARRTSAFKDWFADGTGGGTTQYANTLYSVTESASGTGWTFTAPFNHIVKTITLDDTLPKLQADYVLNGTDVDKLYIRHGLTPNLWNLIARGQYDLDPLSVSLGRIRLANRGGSEPVVAQITYGSNTEFNGGAVDDEPGTTEWDALNMRNQALVHQVELTNVDGQNSFSMSLTLENGLTDTDGDDLPNWWEVDNGLDPEDETGSNGKAGNDDGDAYSNFEEYVLGLNLGVAEFNGLPQGLIESNGIGGFTVTFPVLAGRSYRVWYTDDLSLSWQPAGSSFSITEDNPAHVWTDDGTHTSPEPSTVDQRFFKIEITRP